MTEKEEEKSNITHIPLDSFTLQIFDVMQMMEIERDTKCQCMKSIHDYKNWQAEYLQETDLINLIYLNRKGDMLKKQAQNLVNFYWQIRLETRNARLKYLAKNCISHSAYQHSTDQKAA